MIKHVTNHRMKKILCISAFLCIISLLFIIGITPAATGYELSIYDAYGGYFWILLFLSNSIGYLVVFNQLNKNNKIYSILGFSIIIFSTVIFLALPLFRGYVFFPQGDALSHGGYIKDITLTGHIGFNNFYPFLHILGFDLLNINGLTLMQTTILIYVVTYLLYVFNMYLLSKSISNSKTQILVLTAIACPLLFSYFQTTIHPFMLGIYFLPLVLYLYNKGQNDISNQSLFRILLILLIICVTFIHPVTTIFLIILISGLIFSDSLYQKINVLNALKKKYTLGLPLIMFIVFFSWYFSFIGIQRNFSIVFSSIFNTLTGPTKSIADYQLNNLASANLGLFRTFELAFYKYGGIMIYLILLIISLIIFLIIYREKIRNFKIVLNYSTLVIISLGIALGSLFGYVVIFEPLRIGSALIISISILNGVLIFEILKKYGKKASVFNKLKFNNFFVYFVMFLLITTSIVGFLNVYGGPRIVEPNLEISKMDLTGANWFIDYGDNKVPAAQIGVDLSRLQDLRFGISEYSRLAELGVKDKNRQIVDKTQVPTHFGYDTNDTLSEVFNFKDKFMLISKSGIINNQILPVDIRSKGRQYTDVDLNKLENDYSANEIYNNGEFNVWRVYAS